MGNSVLTRLFDPVSLAIRSSGSAGESVDVTFTSGARTLRATVPARSLWVAVKDVLVFQDYELMPLFRLESLPADSTVVDAGAFVGLYSLKASPFAKRVVAVEPSRISYSLLAHNIRINNLANVSARRLALTASSLAAFLREAGTDSTVVPERTNDSYEVETTTLGGLVEELGNVDLLKMDIEGSEYDVILRTDRPTLKMVDRIVAELHVFSAGDNERLTRLLGYLKESGMTASVIGPPFHGLAYGVTKPWRCSLEKVDGRSAFAYRLFLSGAYAMASMFPAIKYQYDTGTTYLLYAARA